MEAQVDQRADFWMHEMMNAHFVIAARSLVGKSGGQSFQDCAAMRSPARDASAMMVHCGLTRMLRGKTLASQT